MPGLLSKYPHGLRTVAALSLLLLMAGCVTPTSQQGAYDPNEQLNRHVSSFNDVVDKLVLNPLSTGYVKITPKPVRTSVSNFFDNALYPNTILNDFLQGKAKQGTSDVGRFLVNTTLGIGGLFDPATPMGLKKHQEDFGQTLGVWGASQGAYLVLPVLGPNTARDVPDLAVSTFTNVLFYAGFFLNPAVTISVTALGVIDARSRAENAVRFRNDLALDPYIFTREGWTQHRQFLIYDGHPPITFDDEFGDEFGDEPGTGDTAPAGN